MATEARSIDAATSGYIRHRFVRALAASALVTVVFGVLAAGLVGVAGALTTGALEEKLLAPVVAVVVFVVLLLPLLFLVGVMGALVDVLHRRIVGLALLAAALAALVFTIAGLATSIGILLGMEIDDGTGRPVTRIDAVWMSAFSLAGLVISYEVFRHAWWQLSAAKEDFRAVRGWRPPPWRLLTTVRRHLGLPGFLSYVGRKRVTVTLLYFGVAVLNVGVIMLITLPPMFAVLAEEGGEIGLYAMIAVMAALLLLNLLGAGALLARLADRRATKLYQNVREWDARAPIVFLRAFDQDTEMLRARGGDPLARWPAGVGRPRTLDEILLEHASPYGPVIAIGDPRDETPPLGAARVFVPGEGAGWQEVVRGLVGASKAVVMCPNRGEGVQWELDLIAEAGGQLRTIFLASPELDRDATLALFQRFVPDMPEIKPKHAPVAAFSKDGEWRVLTTRRLGVESYTAALNIALQASFGMKGEGARRGA
jgi:hypothetical protein